MTHRYRSPLVDLMGVRYMVAYPGQTLEGMRLAALTQPPIFENPHRLPRTFLAAQAQVMPAAAVLDAMAGGTLDLQRTVLVVEAPPQPLSMTRGSARILRYEPDRVDVECSGDGSALLVLTDTFAPGWTATVDGSAAPVLRADFMFRAVPVPSGAHHVTFAYEPPGWRAGWMVAAGAMLMACLSLLRRRRTQPPKK